VRPNHEEALFLKGFNLQMLGRLEEAIAAYDEYLSARPDDAQVHFNAGHALASLGRCAEAVRHFEQTLELRPDYDEAREHLSECREADAAVRSAHAAGSERREG